MQLIKILLLAGFAAMVVCLTACKNDDSRAGNSSQQEDLQPLPVPKFDRDSAYHFIEKQISFGPRVPNTNGHWQCKEWLVSQLNLYGLSVLEQKFLAKSYDGKTLNGVNIIGQYKPEATKRIFLAAHWDSRHIADSPLNTDRKNQPIPGADDGGSGVAVLLEVARQLQANPVNMGVDFILFDAEDQGVDNDEKPNPESWCLGAQHWSRNLVPSGYQPKYGILLDMVGAKGATFPKEQVSMTYAPIVMNKVWKLAQGLGYSNYFVEVKAGPVTDDHYFINTIAKIPTIDIIHKRTDTETGFGAHWHTHNDDMGIIDVRTLRAVGQTMLEVIYREAAGRF